MLIDLNLRLFGEILWHISEAEDRGKTVISRGINPHIAAIYRQMAVKPFCFTPNCGAFTIA